MLGMSRGLGRIQKAVLAALYEAHKSGEVGGDLTTLMEQYDLDELITYSRRVDRHPNSGRQPRDPQTWDQRRSTHATLRRTFRTLETRKLVECAKKTEPHPSESWSSPRPTATIDRLYAWITEAGIKYVEARGLHLWRRPQLRIPGGGFLARLPRA